MPTQAEVDQRLTDRLAEPKQISADGVTAINDSIPEILSLADRIKQDQAAASAGGNPFRMIAVARIPVSGDYP